MVEATLVEPNVAAAQKLVGLLDAAGMPPRAVVWTYTSDADSWRLWIVPTSTISDKREFYLGLAELFSAHSRELAGLDLGAIQFVSPEHPVVRGLGRIFRIAGTADVRFSNNMLNGFFLPDAVILRMNV